MNQYLFFVPILALSLQAFAQTASFEDGHSGVGGGDNCRQEIEKHRDQIGSWIQTDYAKKINFSKAKVTGLDYFTYVNQMLPIVEKDKVMINCYTNLDDFNRVAQKYNVFPEKVELGAGCINYHDENQVPHIGCDYQSIMLEKDRQQKNPDSPSGNYKLIHHELATIAGVELRLGPNRSDFSISDQLAQFQYYEVDVKLGPLNVRNDANLKEFKVICEKAYRDRAGTRKRRNQIVAGITVTGAVLFVDPMIAIAAGGGAAAVLNVKPFQKNRFEKIAIAIHEAYSSRSGNDYYEIINRVKAKYFTERGKIIEEQIIANALNGLTEGELCPLKKILADGKEVRTTWNESELADLIISHIVK